MPNIGDTVSGDKIGKRQRDKYFWVSCMNCKEERWVKYRPRLPLPKKCKKCSEIPTGRRLLKNGGYIIITIPETDFFYPMSNKRALRHSGTVREHRLVMAKHLGRCLHSWEIVHHKNHIRNDNRIENLQLVTDDRHRQITILEMKIKSLESRVLMLEIENERLKNELVGNRT